MLHPAGEPAYATFPVCSSDGTHVGTLQSFTAGTLTGLDEVEFREAWLGPTEGPRISEPVGCPRQRTVRGRGRQHGRQHWPGTGLGGKDSLTVAVLLRHATSAAAAADGVTFQYQIDGTTYTGHADVTFGVCASVDTRSEDPQ